MTRHSQRLFEFGPFRLDADERLLLRNGERVPLTPKVFEMLVALVEHRGRLIEKEQLMKLVWPDSFVEEGNLTTNISILRKALGEGGGVSYIETIPRVGYRFTSEVTELPPAVSELVFEKHQLTRIETEEIEEEVSNEKVASATTLTTAVSHPRRAATLVLALTLISISLVTVSALLYRRWNAPGGWWRRSAVSETSARPARTIAVLPFKAIGVSSDEEYLGLGMTDALITRLGQSRRITVRPTSAVRRYAGPHQDPVVVGRQEGVEVVLDGSIQRAGDRVRVTVQLINVASGESIWSGQFDEPFTDMFAVQDAISQRVMRDLLVELNTEERTRLGRRGTENAEAYQNFLKGRFFWSKRTNEDSAKAADYFRKAIEIDPAYAQAHGGLADALLLLTVGKAETVAAARTALRHALELDETLAESHATLGLLMSNFDRDWPGAEREFRRAIELDPNNATAHHRYGEFLAHMGRFDEGLAELKMAQELDPLSLIISADTGKVYLYARQYDRGIQQCQRTLEIDPNFSQAHGCLGFGYSLTGQHEAAIAELHRVRGLDEGIWLSYVGYVYAVAGRRTEAQNMLTRLNVFSKSNYVPPSCRMLVYAGLGDKEEAFKWAERMFEEQDFGVLVLKVSPVFDSLRTDPRYTLLLRRAKLN